MRFFLQFKKSEKLVQTKNKEGFDICNFQFKKVKVILIVQKKVKVMLIVNKESESDSHWAKN